MRTGLGLLRSWSVQDDVVAPVKLHWQFALQRLPNFVSLPGLRRSFSKCFPPLLPSNLDSLLVEKNPVPLALESSIDLHTFHEHHAVIVVVFLDVDPAYPVLRI